MPDLTRTQIEQIATNQLSFNELMILRLLASLEPQDVADLLEVSRQYVSKTRLTAIKKLEHQKEVI